VDVAVEVGFSVFDGSKVGQGVDVGRVAEIGTRLGDAVIVTLGTVWMTACVAGWVRFKSKVEVGMLASKDLQADRQSANRISKTFIRRFIESLLYFVSCTLVFGRR
jgi:hypothetical protein